MKLVPLSVLALSLSLASFSAAKPCAPPAAKVAPGPQAPQKPLPDDPEVQRIMRGGGLVRSNWVPPGRSDRYGHAETVIRAPLVTVLSQVQAYGQYKDLAPSKFKTSRIVGKEPEGTDVYMQVQIMNGFITLWWIMRFGEPRDVKKGAVWFEGVYQKGNLQTAHAMFYAREVTPDVTVLMFDLLIGLPIPAPQENIDEELRDAAADAVNGAREKSERAARAAEAARVGSAEPSR
ncbi:MAG: hypothetical protein U0174_07890 [Polyangiaceae bacterium]